MPRQDSRINIIFPKDEECQRSKVAFYKMPRQNKFRTFFPPNFDLPQLRGNLYNNKWSSLKHYF